MAAILFFHEHVMSIVTVVLSDGTSNDGKGCGNAVLLRARYKYCGGCRRTGRAMVGKVAATLFFRKHVVSIVMVIVRRNKQWWGRWRRRCSTASTL